MTWEDAIKKAIKQYFKGKEPEEYNKANGGERKFSKKYLDGLKGEFNVGKVDKDD